jgi:hypothetical protein
MRTSTALIVGAVVLATTAITAPASADDTLPKAKEALRELKGDLTGNSYVDGVYAVLAKSIPLSPILFPIGNDVGVREWFDECIAETEGWRDDALTCYGGGFAPEPEKPSITRPVRPPSAT